MNITFLGTGTSAGVPMIGCPCDVCNSSNEKDKRLRSSVLIESEGKTIVIDTGPDFRQQMLRYDVRNLDAVLFTHEHKDHVAGLDDIRAYNFLTKKPMQIYAADQVIEALQREFHYVFFDYGYPGVPKLDVIRIDHEHAFKAAGLNVVPIRVMHHKLPVLGFRIGDFTYITDANHIEEQEKEKIKGSKIIVLNVLRKEDHLSHFTLEEAVSLMQEFRPEQGYFTHISHQLGLHEEIQKELPSFVGLAHDGLKLTV